MQCGVEERMIRRVGVVKVKCFKYGEKGYKCRECPLWKRVAHVAKPQKAHQQKKLACPVKRKAQERRLRRIEEEKIVHMAKP